MKKLFSRIAILLTGVLLLPACAGTPPDCTKPEVFCVGLVTEVGRLEDRSLNQSAWEGVQQSATDGVTGWIRYIETVDSRDYAENIAVFGDAGYDVIVTVGSSLGDATQAAAVKYPQVYFIGVDQEQDPAAPGPANLVDLTFPEDRAGFLAGALAAMMSQAHKIGAVCATDGIPPVWRYCEGYRAGAAYVDAQKGTTTEVEVVYHTDVDPARAFTDPGWGAAQADELLDKGVDTVFGVGDRTGNGAVEEAANRGMYVIGVDSDQYYSLPDAAPRMLTSAMKMIAPGVTELIKAAGDAQAGSADFPSGNQPGDVGLAPYHDLDSKVPADVRTLMEQIGAGLRDGSIQTNVSAVKP